MHYDTEGVVLRTRDPSKYSLIPLSKVVGRRNDVFEVRVPWSLDASRILRNIGVRNVPSPIYQQYDWPGRYKPFKHQKETASFLTINKKSFVFSEPGTCKTMSALWAADYLMSIGEVRRCLILCPLSIMQSAWLSDLMSSILHRSAVVCHHSSAERRREMVSKEYEFVIANYDGLPLIADAVRADATFDLIIVDEANHYKTATTRRWKSLNSLMHPDRYLWMMTGTPAAQSPLDAYGLARLVCPMRVPKYFTAWRDMVMRQETRFKWRPRDDAHAKVFDALQPAIRYTKAQCLDLPPVLIETREAPLTPQQLKYYKMLKERMMAVAAGETISAVNAAAGVNKLLQISAGAAYTDDKEVVEFDCAPRLRVLDEVLDETTRKVLVFANYRHSIDIIAEHLEASGVPCEKVHGDVSTTKRTDIFRRFQGTDSPRVLVIQPQAAQHGVTLTAADTVVFWGPVTSVETYEQCISRADRQGQSSTSVTVVHIQGSPIESRMFARLHARVKDHAVFLKIYEEELADKPKVQ